MYKLSKLSNQVQESGLQRLLNIPNISDYISLGLGLPSPDTFPKNMSLGNIDMQYVPPTQKLKSQIKGILALKGIDCLEDEIFLTSGAQQALSLLIRLLCDPGDIVLCEELTYYGFVQAAASSGAKIETIYQDRFDGLYPIELESKIQSMTIKPKILYLIPKGHNPTGVTLDSNRYNEIIKIAAKYDIAIIEDDAYGFLDYSDNPDSEEDQRSDEAKQLPNLSLPGTPKKIDAETQTISRLTSHPIGEEQAQNIFYVSSFSKILAPSLRAGYMIAPKEYHEKLATLKEASDLNVSSFGMVFLSKFLEENSFEDHISNITKIYKEKRDIMADAIEASLSDFVTYKIPQNGMYFWLETVGDIDSMDLHKNALKEKLLIMPGSAFEVTESQMGRNGIRLNFTHPSKEDIEIGIARLGKVFV